MSVVGEARRRLRVGECGYEPSGSLAAFTPTRGPVLTSARLHSNTLLIDFDGTICETARAVRFSLEGALSELSVRIPHINRVGALIESGIPLEETIRSLLCNADISTQEIVRIKHKYREFYNTKGYKYETLFPRAQATLEECARHANIIILSNKGSRAIAAALRRFGLRQLVSAVMAERPDTPVKPDPRLFHAIQQQIPGARHQRFLVVGDTETDLRFARNAGLQSCWATYGYGHGAQCRAVSFDYVLDRFEDLPGILRAWAFP